MLRQGDETLCQSEIHSGWQVTSDIKSGFGEENKTGPQARRHHAVDFNVWKPYDKLPASMPARRTKSGEDSVPARIQAQRVQLLVQDPPALAFQLEDLHIRLIDFKEVRPSDFHKADELLNAPWCWVTLDGQGVSNEFHAEPDTD